MAYTSVRGSDRGLQVRLTARATMMAPGKRDEPDQAKTMHREHRYQIVSTQRKMVVSSRTLRIATRSPSTQHPLHEKADSTLASAGSGQAPPQYCITGVQARAVPIREHNRQRRNCTGHRDGGCT